MNEGLKALEEFRKDNTWGVHLFSYSNLDIVEQALDQAEKNEKVLEILKKKRVNIGWLLISFKCYEQYQDALDNGWTIIKQVSSEPLTRTEFNLLKEWLEK